MISSGKIIGAALLIVTVVELGTDPEWLLVLQVQGGSRTSWRQARRQIHGKVGGFAKIN
jgi:hypothetical protein